MTPPKPRALGVLICALGGEGGGVLSEWLVEAALQAGYPVQSTSIPGVAQRTGATTYYVEIFPVRQHQLGSRRPVLSLYPVPGALDLIVSSELLETVRQIGLGMVSPERTQVLSSSARTLTTNERMQMGDGRIEGSELLALIRTHSQSHCILDMNALAQKANTVVSAVMFGALAASGALPFGRDVCEAVVKSQGKASERSLRGFALAFDAVLAERQLQVSGAPLAQALPVSWADAGPNDPQIASDHPVMRLPLQVRAIARLGYQRMLEYQDQRYADLYLSRLANVVAREQSADAPGTHHFKVASEVARYLALWMAFDDIVRVADLKARRVRSERLKREVKLAPGELLRVYDFFKPGIPEFAALLPGALATRLMAHDRRRIARGQEPLSFPLKINSHGVVGRGLLRFMAGLRWLRPHGSRFVLEQQLIGRWLVAIQAGLAEDWSLGLEIAMCGRLIKGYGSTNERGKDNLLHVVDHLAPDNHRLSALQRAEAIARVRTAALADDAGQAFDQALSKAGAPPRPIKAQPIRFQRRSAQNTELEASEVSRRQSHRA
jgi:indolepyruvate ferredoxin oxidoreductase beta subunit